MANCCFIDIDFEYGSDENAYAAYEKLRQSRDAAAERHEGMYLGSNRRWVFDASFRQTAHTVTISGWTKWTLEPMTMVEFCDYLGEGLLSAHCRYECTEDMQFGTYDWNHQDKIMQLRDLNPIHWPEPPDEATDEERDLWFETESQRLDEALAAYAISTQMTIEEIRKDQEKSDKSLEEFRKSCSDMLGSID